MEYEGKEMSSRIVSSFQQERRKFRKEKKCYFEIIFRIINDIRYRRLN